ncbi:hypothetical protein BT63DRAFT_460604 [Microthyrium microscopicum]|uniref:Rhodanese domain-containing protein n=1 Tax=Microthyrium microscopicum TaxID=703497 RepID=A0A6A6TX43_9PEZI|nr:hypothetical protein BT63DRAFT_460604 [Microthyrium microscopicum]
MSSRVLYPPPGSASIDQILEEARKHIFRMKVYELQAILDSPDSDFTLGPIHVIDIRPEAQRQSEGAFKFNIDGDHPKGHKIHVIERNVLEWRLDPLSDSRAQEIIDPYEYRTRIVVVCSQGYTSSLAARELQRLGLWHATDLDGGVQEWQEWQQAGNRDSFLS